MNKRLLIIGDASVYSYKDNYSMSNPMNIFYGELSKYFKEIYISQPTKKVASDIFDEGYVIDNENVKYLPRPYYNSVEEFIKKGYKIVPQTIPLLNKYISLSDIIFIRLPTPIGFLTFCLSKLQRKKTLIQVKGEWTTTASESGLYKGVKRKLAIMGSLFFQNLTKFMAKRVKTLVHGPEAFEKYSKLNRQCYDIEVSLIRNKNIYYKKDTCNNKLIKLLFVGRISPAKGLNYLLKALNELRNENIRLNIVGTWRSEKIKKEIQNLISNLNIENKINFRGHIPFGEKLFEVYKKSDVFILPSITEGIPKVIFEAMAFGVPIISTRVGGIPSIIKDKYNGLLIEKRNSEKILKAIKDLINNVKLRKTIIENQYKTIKNYTVEKQAKEVASLIKNE